MALAGAESANSTYSPGPSSKTARRPDASEASVVKVRSGPTMRPLVTAFSASYSTNSSGEPTPAVTLGSKATTVAADGCRLKATFQRDGTINHTAINRLARLDQSGITLKPVPLKLKMIAMAPGSV